MAKMSLIQKIKHRNLFKRIYPIILVQLADGYCLITIHGFQTVQNNQYSINPVSSTDEPYLEEMYNR